MRIDGNTDQGTRENEEEGREKPVDLDFLELEKRVRMSGSRQAAEQIYQDLCHEFTDDCKSTMVSDYLKTRLWNYIQQYWAPPHDQ